MKIENMLQRFSCISFLLKPPCSVLKGFDSLTEKKEKSYVKLLKKTCSTRCLSLHGVVDAVFRECMGLIYALKEMQNDKVSGSTERGLLKKISHYEFCGKLY